MLNAFFSASKRNHFPMITRQQIRTFSSKDLNVVHDVATQQFKVSLGGDSAVINYNLDNNNITITHTEVPSVFRGKGVGKILAKEALEYSEKNKLKVKIECDFVQKYYNDYKDNFKNLKVRN